MFSHQQVENRGRWKSFIHSRTNKCKMMTERLFSACRDGNTAALISGLQHDSADVNDVSSGSGKDHSIGIGRLLRQAGPFFS